MQDPGWFNTSERYFHGKSIAYNASALNYSTPTVLLLAAFSMVDNREQEIAPALELKTQTNILNVL
jgi:hypothetical protein